MFRVIVIFGLIAGGILSLMMAITLPMMDSISFERGEVIGYTSMIAAFLLVFFGVRSYRDNVAGGSVSFGRAFGVGMGIVAIAAICYDVTWQVIYTKIGPEFNARYQAHMVEKARASGKSEAEIAKEAADMAKYAKLYENRLINFAVTLLEPLPVGLIVSLVSAGVLSRRRRNGLASGSAPAPA